MSNAIIISADIRIENGWMLDVSLMLDYGDGSVQGFGGWCLRNLSKEIEGSNIAGEYITGVMKVCGVSDWNEVVGKAVRVDLKDDKVRGIGHITDDLWLYPHLMFNRETEK